MEAMVARVPELTPAVGLKRGRVGFLQGCVQRAYFPHVNRATVEVLQAEGWDVHAPNDLACCGSLEQHAGEAHRLRQVVDAKNRAEQLAYQSERTLKEHRDRIPESDASTIEGRIMELKKALEGDDADAIKTASEKLAQSSQKMGAAMYANAQAAGGSSEENTSDESSSSSNDDDVVDAEIVDEEENK